MIGNQGRSGIPGILSEVKGNKMYLLYKDALNIIAFIVIGNSFDRFILYLLRGLLVLVALAIGIFTAWAYTCPRFAGLQFFSELMGLLISL